MKQLRVLTTLILFATCLLCFLSGCATEVNTSIQAGTAAGLAVHGQKVLVHRKAFIDANHHLTHEGREFFKISTVIPRDNRYFWVDDFRDHCMQRCQSNEPTFNEQFCHSYCSCTSEEFRNNIPFQHLMAFGLGQPSQSQPKINQTIGTCAREATEQEQAPPRHELYPSGNPQTNTNSGNTSR